jgi:ABC-type glycerol-3-phosphate transport system permease component
MTDIANRRPLALKTLTTVFLGLWLIAAAFPFVWTVWGSFKVEADFFSRQSWWMAIEGTRTQAQTGGAFTLQGYEGAWIKNEFWKAAINTMIVTLSVTIISLSVGTLGGYALARSGS